MSVREIAELGAELCVIVHQGDWEIIHRSMKSEETLNVC